MNITANIITKTGALPGRTLTIMAGVHGNETCGVIAIKKILPTLTIEKGVVNFIFGNPPAIEQGARFIEANLNRLFRPKEKLTSNELSSYEYARAQEIVPYLKTCDAMIDIHSSATPNSTPFIICEKNSFDLAQKLPFPIRSCGWNIIEPGGSESFVQANGGQGLCLECGYNNDPLAIQRAERAIIIFLNVMGAISSDSPLPDYPQRIIYAYEIYRTKQNFKQARAFDDFEVLKSGELIGTDGNTPVNALNKGDMIIFCRDRSGPNQEAFILAREIKTTQ